MINDILFIQKTKWYIMVKDVDYANAYIYVKTHEGAKNGNKNDGGGIL